MDEQTTPGTEPPEQPAGGQQPVPPYPQQPAAYGQPPYSGYAGGGYAGSPAVGPPVPASTVVLLVISGLLTLSCYGTVIGLAPLVLSIIAMTRYKQEPARARQLTRIGWIVLAAVGVVVVLAVIAAIVFFVAIQSGPDYGPSY